MKSFLLLVFAALVVRSVNAQGHTDSLYHTAPYRVFIGHSPGGLLVIDALVHIISSIERSITLI